MRYLLGGLVLLYVVFLIIGLITGRVKIKSCCAIADPERDLRMNPRQDL